MFIKEAKKYNIKTKNSTYIMCEVEVNKNMKVVSITGPGIKKSGKETLYGLYDTTRIDNLSGKNLTMDLYEDPELKKWVGSIITSKVMHVEAEAC